MEGRALVTRREILCTVSLTRLARKARALDLTEGKANVCALPRGKRVKTLFELATVETSLDGFSVDSFMTSAVETLS